MKKNKTLKLALFITFIVFLGILIKLNVTAKKEPTLNNHNESTSTLNLELGSDLIKNVFSKLTLLASDSLYDEEYKYLYFTNESEKRLILDEKLFIVFNNLYKNQRFEIEKLDDNTEKLIVKEEIVKQEFNDFFKEQNINLNDIEFRVSKNFGIVDYKYENKKFELKYIKFNKNKVIDKIYLNSAYKEGNFIKLSLSGFHAEANKDEYTDEDKVFTIKNFGEKKALMSRISKKYIEENEQEIIDSNNINQYVFSFELKGDDYFLDNIKKVELEN